MLVLQGLKSYTPYCAGHGVSMQPQTTMLVHMFLNGKGSPSDSGLHGCNLVSVLLLLWMS